jgi:hypothetical protein
MYLIAFPLLLVPFVLYNMIAFLLNMAFGDTVFSIPLQSQRSMPVTAGDVLVLLAVLLLYVEILKATRLGRRHVIDHLLSLVLFAAMAFEFAAVPRAATSTFLVLLALSFVDVIGGFSIAIRTAQLARAARRSEPTAPPAHIAMGQEEPPPA